MKSTVIDAKRLSSIFLLFALAGTLVTFTPQDAYANPSPGLDCEPTSIVQGQNCEVHIEAVGFATEVRSIQVAETPTGDAATSSCNSNPIGNMFANTPATSRVWEARWAGDTTQRIGISLVANSEAFIDFASGTIALSDASDLGTGSDDFTRQDTEATNLVGGYTTVVNNPSVIWIEITGNLPSAVDTQSLGFWRVGICADEAGDTNQAFPGSFEVQLPVAGTLIPISATALILAGMYTSALWIVPAVGAAVGLGIYTLARKHF